MTMNYVITGSLETINVILARIDCANAKLIETFDGFKNISFVLKPIDIDHAMLLIALHTNSSNVEDAQAFLKSIVKAS